MDVGIAPDILILLTEERTLVILIEVIGRIEDITTGDGPTATETAVEVTITLRGGIVTVYLTEEIAAMGREFQV